MTELLVGLGVAAMIGLTAIAYNRPRRYADLYEALRNSLLCLFVAVLAYDVGVLQGVRVGDELSERDVTIPYWTLAALPLLLIYLSFLRTQGWVENRPVEADDREIEDETEQAHLEDRQP